MSSYRTLAALLLLPTALLAQSDSEPGRPATPPASPPAAGSAPEEASRELAEKREELSKVTLEIGQIQSRAESVDDVKALRDRYRETLQAEMVRAAPELKRDIERQIKLVQELNNQPEPGAEGAPSEEQQQQQLTEYRELQQKLAPVEAGVRDVPAVQESRQEYYNRLIAEMQRIEPRTDELLAKHRELVAVVRELTVQAGTG